MNGADKLLGRGDMLFIEPQAARPVRAQGGLISDSEIERIINFIKSQRETVYDESVMTVQEKKAAGKTFEKDDLFDEAVKTVLETKQASVSILQGNWAWIHKSRATYRRDGRRRHCWAVSRFKTEGDTG